MHSSKRIATYLLVGLFSFGFLPKMSFADAPAATATPVQPVVAKEHSKVIQELKDEIKKLEKQVADLKKELEQRKQRAEQKKQQREAAKKAQQQQEIKNLKSN